MYTLKRISISLKIILLSLSIASSTNLKAQTSYSTVSGFILDSLTNEKVQFANVFVPAANIEYGVVSDINGFYALELPEGKRQIMVTYIGYEDKTIDVEISADKPLSKNILISVPILKRPKAGEAIEDIYGHWKIKCIERDGKVFKAKKNEKQNGRYGLYYSRFPDHEAGIGIFEYSLGGDKIGEFYFRHSGDGQITMNHVFLQEVTMAGRERSKIYNNLNIGKIYDAYTVSFKSADKMIIENDMIRMVCKRVE